MTTIIPGPSAYYSIAPTADATAINAAITAANTAWLADGRQRVVRLAPGTYATTAAIVGKAGVMVAGTGQDSTLIAPTFSGGADDPLNAIVTATGALDTAKCNTTVITSALGVGQASLTVGSVGTLAAGDYVEIAGNNSTLGAPALGDSDGASVLVTAVYKVAAAAAGTITLATPAVVHHAIGSTVKAVSVVRDFGVVGVGLDGSGGAVADGILARYTRDLRVEDVALKGLSRFGLELALGAHGTRLDALRSGGAVNGLVWFNSAHESELSRVTCDADGARYHASGTPRGLITFQNRPSGAKLSSIQLARGCWGFRRWGGHHITISDVRVSDMDCREGGASDGYTRAVTAGEYDDGGQKYGVAADGVAGPLAYVEIPFGWTCSDWTIERITCDVNHEWAHAIWLHDVYAEKWSGLTIDNRGPMTWASGTRCMRGILLRDVYEAEITDLTTYGLYTHLATDNSIQTSCTIDHWHARASAGSGTSGYAMYLGQLHPSGWVIRHARWDNFNVPFLIKNSTFTDYSLRFEHLDIDGALCASAVLAKNESGVALSPGHLVELLASSPAGTVKIEKATSGDGKRVGVWMCGYDDALGNGKGYGIIGLLPSPGGQSVLCNGTVNIGDTAEVGSTDGEGTAGTTNPIGRAITSRSGVGSSLVVLGPV